MLQIIVGNNIRIRGASVPLRAAITAALTANNPAYLEKKKKKQPTWGIDQKLTLYSWDLGDLVAPRGFAKELQDILHRNGIAPEKVITWCLNDPHPVDFGSWNPEYPPREYQVPAIDAAVANDGVLVSPAGSGKTLMGLYIVREWGLPALWLTHTKELLYQTATNAQKYMPGVGKVGIIGDSKLEWGSGKLIVATVQTLNANPTLVATLNSLIGTLVIDEAHHFPAAHFIEVAGKFNALHFLGLTATPRRKDFLEMYMYQGIGPACYEVPREALHDAGSLILPEVEFIYTEFEPASGIYAEDNVDAGGEDLDYIGLMKELMADETRAKLVADRILEACIEVAPKGGASIVLADNVRYLWQLHYLVTKFAKVRLGGVVPRIAVVHGGMQQHTWRKVSSYQKAIRAVESGVALEWRNHGGTGNFQIRVQNYTDEEMQYWQVTGGQRKAIMELAYARKLDIIFATGQLVREGLDLPNLYRGHLTTPQRGDARTSKNGTGVEQAIGRIQRPDPNNPDKKAVWYDYVDFKVGVFQDQYYSRRSVYKRLGIKLPKKKASRRDMVQDFILSGKAFDGMLPL